MSAATTTIKSLLSLFNFAKPHAQSAIPARRTMETTAVQVIDEETAFLASIAELTPEEQAKRIERRDWYTRLAERQAIADVEWRSIQALR